MPAFLCRIIMKKTALFLLACMPGSTYADLLDLSNPADAVASHGINAYASGSFFAGSDYTPIKQFTGNWDGPFNPGSGRNLTISEGRVEAGAVYGTWRIAALYREEVIVDSNKDTATIVYDNKHNLPVPAGQNFDVHLRMEGFEAKGARLDKAFLFDGQNGTRYTFGAGISLLEGTRVRMTNADGTASSTLTGYTYNATLQDENSRGTYPYITPATPLGRGYALDLGAKIRWKNGSHLDLAANDLLGQMRWTNMPYTIETANSATLTRNAAGYIVLNPTLSGHNDIYRRTIVQNLITKVSAQYTRPISNVDLTAGTDWVAGYWLPQGGFAYRFASSWKATLDYDFRFGSIGVGIMNRWFHIDLRSDSSNFGSAQAVGLDAGVKISF